MTTVSFWTRRDPFDALVRSAFGPSAAWPAVEPSGFTPAAEVIRDGADAEVRLELPGLDLAKDVTVEVDRGRLVVRGERRDERTDSDESDRSRRVFREVRYGSFRR